MAECQHHAHEHHHSTVVAGDHGTMVKDPVCGMDVDPAAAKGGSAEHGGTTYFFCSAKCREKFVADPPSYLGARVLVREAGVPASTIYTCPMHPEVRQVGPGTCPKCGMALEPEMISLEEQENPELADMTRRFWVSLILTVPVFLSAMSEMVPGDPVGRLLSPTVLLWA